LTGHKKGFQAEIRLIANHVNFIHRIIHRESLASRDFQPQLHTVLQEAAKVVNFVEAHPLKPRLFVLLCENMQADPNYFFAFGGKVAIKK
jgi:hypothetical protein